MADKIYAKGIWIKTRETSFGDVLKVSIKASDFGPFVKEHKNEKGYINFDILKRKEPSEKGETHYVVLDTWKPDGSKSSGEQSEKKPAAKKPAAKAPAGGDDAFPEDDIPF